MRRCLFYYIPFPEPSELEKIIKAHFGQEITELFAAALQKFWGLRKQARFQWRKDPSTSELLDWVQILERDEQAGRLDHTALAATPLHALPHLEALVKTQSDRDAVAGMAQADPENIPARQSSPVIGQVIAHG